MSQQLAVSCVFSFVADCRKRFAGKTICLFLSLFGTAACASTSGPAFSVSSNAGNTLNVEALGEFNQPWAMSFLPSGELLVTEKGGRLWFVSAGSDSDNASLSQIAADSIERVLVVGVPAVEARGQGGLGDVIVHPSFDTNSTVYLSFVEREGDVSGAAVMRATLDLGNKLIPKLVDQKVIWRQFPKVTGEGHYGHKLAFSQDGYLFVTSGERQKFDPAQDMKMNLGKVIRLNDDGSLPTDNPWAQEDGVAPEFWSIGHRNPLGIAFADDGQLWVHEMGPRGGDELNKIARAGNYGYPLVSNGRHYSGLPIPDHDTRPDLLAPEVSWSPVISPSSLIIYTGDRYPDWNGSALIGGLSSKALIRVSLDSPVSEAERYDFKQRIREIEQDGNGVVYLLEDKAGGRLLRLVMP